MLLSGDTNYILKDEATAVIFAPHYVDTKGEYSPEVRKQIIETYGTEKVLGIPDTIRMIFTLNIYSILLSAFRNRIKGKKIEQTTLFYELKMIISIVFCLPVAFVRTFILKLLVMPVVDFKNN